MMKLVISTALAFALWMPSSASACPDKEKGATAQTAAISVDAAAAKVKTGKVVMVDANSPSTRKE